LFTTIKQQKGKFLFSTISRTLVFVLSFSLIFSPTASYAQSINLLNLPAPGTMVFTSPAFNPAIVTGIKIYPDNPLQFDFIIDIGDDQLQGEALKEESQKLINYFMATLTVPEDEMWVNLSPYEKDRIIAKGLSHTEMGRDMLAQDYLLKQLTASLMYPEDDFGKEFWNRVYSKAQAEYGTTEIPMNTFNKIWIVPDEAVVYVHDTNVFVVENHLKVMLEEDYLALESNVGSTKHGLGNITKDDIEVVSGVSAEIIREVLLPEIEKEVNEGKNFANLRQMYNSMLLATWYKKNLKESLLGQVYVNKNKVNGIELENKEIKQKIYDRYVEAFEKGVYSYIKEDIDSATKKVIPRKYFSGGLSDYSSTPVKEMRDRGASSPLIEKVAGRPHVMVSIEGKPLGHGEDASSMSSNDDSRQSSSPVKLNRRNFFLGSAASVAIGLAGVFIVDKIKKEQAVPISDDAFVGLWQESIIPLYGIVQLIRLKHSQEIFTILTQNGFINSEGYVTDKFTAETTFADLNLPQKYETLYGHGGVEQGILRVLMNAKSGDTAGDDEEASSPLSVSFGKDFNQFNRQINDIFNGSLRKWNAVSYGTYEFLAIRKQLERFINSYDEAKLGDAVDINQLRTVVERMRSGEIQTLTYHSFETVVGPREMELTLTFEEEPAEQVLGQPLLENESDIKVVSSLDEYVKVLEELSNNIDRVGGWVSQQARGFPIVDKSPVERLQEAAPDQYKNIIRQFYRIWGVGLALGVGEGRKVRSNRAMERMTGRGGFDVAPTFRMLELFYYQEPIDGVTHYISEDRGYIDIKTGMGEHSLGEDEIKELFLAPTEEGSSPIVSEFIELTKMTAKDAVSAYSDPIVWLLERLGIKKKKGEDETSDDNAPDTASDQGYIGEAYSWPIAFRTALELFREGEIDGVATVSLDEFQRGNYFEVPIREAAASLGVSDEDYLAQLWQMFELIYTGNDRFILLKETMKVEGGGLPTGKSEMPYLTIIYLKPGEEYTHPEEASSPIKSNFLGLTRDTAKESPRLLFSPITWLLQKFGYMKKIIHHVVKSRNETLKSIASEYGMDAAGILSMDAAGILSLNPRRTLNEPLPIFETVNVDFNSLEQQRRAFQRAINESNETALDFIQRIITEDVIPVISIEDQLLLDLFQRRLAHYPRGGDGFEFWGSDEGYDYGTHGDLPLLKRRLIRVGAKRMIEERIENIANDIIQANMGQLKSAIRSKKYSSLARIFVQGRLTGPIGILGVRFDPSIGSILSTFFVIPNSTKSDDTVLVSIESDGKLGLDDADDLHVNLVRAIESYNIEVASSPISRIVSSESLVEGAKHKVQELDGLLFKIVNSVRGGSYSDLSTNLRTVVEPLRESGQVGRAGLIMKRVFWETQFTRMGYDEPPIQEYIQQLIDLIMLTRTGAMRAVDAQDSILRYIATASIVAVTEEHIEEVVESAINGETREHKDSLTIWSWNAPKLFNATLINRLLDETKVGSDRRAGAIEAMNQIMYSGVPTAIVPEVIAQYLANTQDYWIAHPFSLDKPFQIMIDAIRHNSNIVNNEQLLTAVGQYRQALVEFSSVEANKTEHEREIEYANQQDERLQQAIAQASSSPLKIPGGIDFNPNNVNLTEQGDKVQINFTNTGIQNFNPESINGILPVIINISPLPSILPLLGLAPKEEEFEVSSLN